MLTVVGSVQPAKASSILYFSDLSVGPDRMAQALTSSEVTSTYTVTTAASVDAFTTLLNGGGFSLAILFEQNQHDDPGWDAAFDALGGFLAGGGAAIADDWTGTATHIAPFGAAFTGNTNDGTMTVVNAALLPGVSNPLSLTNPSDAWTVFSNGLSVSGGATCGASNSTGECAIVIKNGGRSFFNGFLNDTFADGSQGVNIYVNEITGGLRAASPVPEPTTMIFVGSGLLVASRKSRRKPAETL